MAGKYVAYVSCYTTAQNNGIKIFDVDEKAGKFISKGEVPIKNSSYMTLSHSRKMLYSITDFGVESYLIEADGGLKLTSAATINGMRGCYLSTDYEDKYLFVAGYHDGKITVLNLDKNGGIIGIVDEVFHKGIGSIADRSFRPHVNCVKMTRDNKYLLAADLGLDHIKVYSLNHNNGKLKLVDIIHSEQYSGPRHMKLSKDGKYLYVVHEVKNYIDVYEYTEVAEGDPEFEKIQTISTLNDYHAGDSAASALKLSADGKYLISSNAGDNSVVVYNIDKKSGELSKIMCLPISGSYPKDAALFPDNKHLVSLNHENDTMTFFSTDYEKGTLVMNTKEIKIQKPNCIIFKKLGE